MKTILVDAYNTFVIADQWVDTSMFELLESYENTKLIVTNATLEQTKEFGLVDLPYDMFSMEHEPNKTDPLYFTTLLEKFELKTEDVVYFEHNAESVTAAASIWIAIYWFDHSKRDLIALKAFLDDNL